MMGNKRISLKLFIDGKEITNFITEDIQVIKLDDENSTHLMRRFDFESRITLNAKQVRRLIFGLIRASWQWHREQWKQRIKRW